MTIKRLAFEVESRELTIVAKLRSCFDNFWGKNISDMQLLALAKKLGENAEFCVAEDLVWGCLGCVAYYRNNLETKVAFLSILVTKKGFENKGIGSLLLDAVEKDCLRHDFVSIQLEVAADNDVAITFYTKRNYLLTGVGKQGYLCYSKNLGI